MKLTKRQRVFVIRVFTHQCLELLLDGGKSFAVAAKLGVVRTNDHDRVLLV